MNIRRFQQRARGGCQGQIALLSSSAAALLCCFSLVFSSDKALAQDYSIRVRWTATGDDGYVGRASGYDIRYSLAPISEANWDAATQAAGEAFPGPVGTTDSFTITGLLPTTTYWVAIRVRDEAFNWSALSNVISKTTSFVTDVEEDPQLPDDFELRNCYPNPFNPATTIECALPVSSHLSVSVCNVLGQHVRQISDAVYPAGVHTFRWDGTDDRGAGVASGVYVYRMETGQFAQSKLMTLMR